MCTTLENWNKSFDGLTEGRDSCNRNQSILFGIHCVSLWSCSTRAIYTGDRHCIGSCTNSCSRISNVNNGIICFWIRASRLEYRHMTDIIRLYSPNPKFLNHILVPHLNIFKQLPMIIFLYVLLINLFIMLIPMRMFRMFMRMLYIQACILTNEQQYQQQYFGFGQYLHIFIISLIFYIFFNDCSVRQMGIETVFIYCGGHELFTLVNNNYFNFDHKIWLKKYIRHIKFVNFS